MTDAERRFRQQYMLTWLANSNHHELDDHKTNRMLRDKAFIQSGIAWNLLKDWDQLSFSDFGDGA